MPNFLCTTCGTQYTEMEQPPPSCPVCQDKRQYLKKTGQRWATLEKLRLTNRNSIAQVRADPPMRERNPDPAKMQVAEQPGPDRKAQPAVE
jgi:DNA-directed RNA polymerase subunit RPC12/RpoP